MSWHSGWVKWTSSSDGRLRSNQQLHFAASNKNTRTNAAVNIEAYADVYDQQRIQMNNEPGSHWSHNTRRFTRVDVWCSQFDQVWHHTRDALITQKELKNWLNQQRVIHHDRCVWDLWTIRNELIRA